MKALISLFVATVLAEKQCSPVCQKTYCHSTAAADIQMCKEGCCRADDAPIIPEQEYQTILKGKDYYTDVGRSPNCNWDLFQECRAQYEIDWNYYKRYECVQQSGCVGWTTFNLKN